MNYNETTQEDCKVDFLNRQERQEKKEAEWINRLFLIFSLLGVLGGFSTLQFA